MSKQGNETKKNGIEKPPPHLVNTMLICRYYSFSTNLSINIQILSTEKIIAFVFISAKI